ncbi:MAG: UDP-N-acetylglucosamine--N-acetylmuramyl-(pentapeptide) pyrophosphoryl-undecaprenol N-acetylglucosamine transferase [Candidatus Paceibacterota bacterium]|jgi:UDP-N-acetylglucosamine--N-acetylmuramyl-(pentapeptide) pyrophosphoryl-undecaprenol N-acetylglucosamine transferase
MKKIVFTGGGTGGHVFPIIAVAEEMRKRDLNLDLSYIGPSDFTSETFLKKEKIRTHYISSGKIRRYFSVGSFFANLIDVLFKIPFGIFQSFIIMFFTAPDLVFSKGGFGSIPVVFSAWLLRIPVFMHESDVVPGLANKIGSRFSEKVLVSFPIPEMEYFKKEKMIETGNPVRKDLAEGNREEAQKLFGLTYEKPVILILGGSQGSERINDVILEMLPDMLKEFEVIHQTGLNGLRRVKEESVAMIDKDLLKYYHPYFFLDERELSDAYAASDCVVGRAGAGTIFEIALVKKPSILVPLPESAQNHQVKNAYSYAKNGACLVLEEGNFIHHFFLEKLRLLLKDDAEKMKAAAEQFSKPFAANVIARYLIDFLS